MENILEKRVSGLEDVTKILTEVSNSQVQNQDKLVNAMNLIANNIGNIITKQVGEELKAYKGVIDGRFDGVDVKVSEISKTIKNEEVSATQSDMINKARSRRIIHITGGTRSDLYKVFGSAYFALMGDDIKRKFSETETPLIAFKNIKKNRYDDVISYINTWNPSEQAKRNVINDLLILRDKVDEWRDAINNNAKLSKAKQIDYGIKINKNEKKIKAFEKYLNKELNKDEI